MALTLRFNDSLVLKGYLNQALPQMGIENDPKIVVGDSGGLAYCLFEPGRREESLVNLFPTNFNVRTLGSLETVTEYVRQVHRYTKMAAGFAKELDFKQVSVSEGEFASPKTITTVTEADKDTELYSLGIGDSEIESMEKLERFLAMVKIAKNPLEEAYAQIIGLAQKLSK